MIISDFIEELKQKEIEISFTAGKLKYSGPEEYITPELIENLKKYKGKLMKHFWPKDGNFMPINTDGDKTPFVLVHGQEANYRLSEYLGQNHPMYGFFHYGSKGEENTFKDLKLLASNYIAQIQRVIPIGPYLLGGFSFGGVLVYEMAIQLKKAGHEVPLLIIIDSVSPFAKEPFKWKKTFLKILYGNILYPSKEEILHILKSAICKCFILFNIPIPTSLRKFYIVNNYIQMFKAYQPEKFDGDLVLFRATENTSSYEFLGWEQLVNNIKIYYLEGKHLTLYYNLDMYKIIVSEIEKVV